MIVANNITLQDVASFLQMAYIVWYIWNLTVLLCFSWDQTEMHAQTGHILTPTCEASGRVCDFIVKFHGNRSLTGLATRSRPFMIVVDCRGVMTGTLGLKPKCMPVRYKLETKYPCNSEYWQAVLAMLYGMHWQAVIDWSEYRRRIYGWWWPTDTKHVDRCQLSQWIGVSSMPRRSWACLAHGRGGSTVNCWFSLLDDCWWFHSLWGTGPVSPDLVDYDLS